MARPPRDPFGELLLHALVAAGMSLAMLILTRGKWLTALLIGIWLIFTILRLRRGR
ncbi:MAG: hypothetical protein REI09_02255 [Candidatus Dactylopiibacterium sp.]|nr:hypothetical protein [Candidatus Dactylopiibacterium sp.]